MGKGKGFLWQRQGDRRAVSPGKLSAILSKAGVNRGQESNASERQVTVLSTGFQDISHASEENTQLPPLGMSQFTSFTLTVLLRSGGWRTCDRGLPRPGNRGTPPETPQLESGTLAPPRISPASSLNDDATVSLVTDTESEVRARSVLLTA